MAGLLLAGLATALNVPATAPPNAYQRIRAAGNVLRVSDGAALPLTNEWGASDRAVVVFFRSFG